MKFGAAVQSFFSNYVNFKGRARRSEYWFVALFLVLTNIVTTIIDGVVFAEDLDVFLGEGGFGPLGLLWTVGVFLPSLALLIRRLHDTNRSAWWILFILVPFAGPIVLFVFTLFDSTAGDNRYGPSPKEHAG